MHLHSKNDLHQLDKLSITTERGLLNLFTGSRDKCAKIPLTSFPEAIPGNS
jgi:hypothetical protein